MSKSKLKKNEKEVTKSLIAVTVFSSLVVILGIMMVVAAIVFATQDSLLNDSDFNDTGSSYDNTLFTVKTTVLVVTLVFTGITVAIGAVGISFLPCWINDVCKLRTKKDMKKPVAYGFCIFIMWVIYIILACLVMTVSYSVDYKVTALCEYEAAKVADPSLPERYFDSITDRLSGIDYSVAANVTQLMCTAQCPCDKQYEANWNDLTADAL